VVHEMAHSPSLLTRFVVKTIGCVLGLSSFLALVIFAKGKDTPVIAYWIAGVFSLTSLTLLCDRDSIIELMIQQLPATIRAWRSGSESRSSKLSARKRKKISGLEAHAKPARPRWRDSSSVAQLPATATSGMPSKTSEDG
jgi:hypothetical protein